MLIQKKMQGTLQWREGTSLRRLGDTSLPLLACSTLFLALAGTVSPARVGLPPSSACPQEEPEKSEDRTERESFWSM